MPVAVEQIKFNPEIDKFLNIEDQTIFTNFKQFLISEIHSQRQEFYRLIEQIHEFDNLVSVTGNMRANQIPQIKQNLQQATQVNKLIRSYATDDKGKLYYLLTDEQQQYYRKVVTAYEKLLTDYNLKFE